ncbi:MAG: hypothetical protein F9K43_28940, partial [Bauldia sp.]
MEASGNGMIGGGQEGGAAPLLQPHNLDAEQSVLGAMMVSVAALDPVMGEARLRSEDFYRGRHATIYAAIQELYERNEPVDALTVSEHLRALGKLEEVGGQDVINSLAATTTHDIYVPLSKKAPTDAATFKAGRWFALMWGCVLT